MEQLFENTNPQCGAIVQSDGSLRWRVWAPKADRVDVVLINGDARTLSSIPPVILYRRSGTQMPQEISRAC